MSVVINPYFSGVAVGPGPHRGLPGGKGGVGCGVGCGVRRRFAARLSLIPKYKHRISNVAVVWPAIATIRGVADSGVMERNETTTGTQTVSSQNGYGALHTCLSIFTYEHAYLGFHRLRIPDALLSRQNGSWSGAKRKHSKPKNVLMSVISGIQST